jgi:hypothetical protein
LGLREAGYVGPVGVDAFVYRKCGSGVLALRRVVEVNPRYTMGRLAWELMRRVSAGHWVRFEIATKGEFEKSVEVDDAGRMTKGTLILNDADAAQRVWAVLRVGKRWENLI